MKSFYANKSTLQIKKNLILSQNSEKAVYFKCFFLTKKLCYVIGKSKHKALINRLFSSNQVRTLLFRSENMSSNLIKST